MTDEEKVKEIRQERRQAAIASAHKNKKWLLFKDTNIFDVEEIEVLAEFLGIHGSISFFLVFCCFCRIAYNAILVVHNKH